MCWDLVPYPLDWSFAVLVPSGGSKCDSANCHVSASISRGRWSSVASFTCPPDRRCPDECPLEPSDGHG